MQSITRALTRFEEILTVLIEGTLSRAFHTPLQPVELAKRIAATMENAPHEGPRGGIVPNVYSVRLNPGDWETFKSILPSLEAELVRYTRQAAEERDLVLAAPAQVRVIADQAVPLRGVRTVAQFSQATTAAGVAESTQHIPPLPRAKPPRVHPPALVLPQISGMPVPARFDITQTRVRIGRALDNDVVLEDDRVSRNHAELRQEGERWRLVDLNSSNGTFVNGRRVAEDLLSEGDRIQLGDVELVFAA